MPEHVGKLGYEFEGKGLLVLEDLHDEGMVYASLSGIQQSSPKVEKLGLLTMAHSHFR